MRSRIAALTLISVFSLCVLCQADFKYTETTQMTGGAMQGMMKFAGVLSKNARQANAPMQTTVYVKGNRYRRDEADGKVHIIDLDGHRMIDLDTSQHTYTVITFEQMKQARDMAIAQAKAAQAQQAQTAGTPPPNVTITPKVEVTPTGATRTILYRPAQEVKMRAEMQMQSDDPRAQGQTASFIITADSWIAPSVPGYDEIRKFNQRMAKEFEWVPTALSGGGAAFGNGNGSGGLHLAPAMVELRKQSASLDGFPLLQYSSIGMAGNGQNGPNGQNGAPGQQGMQQPPPDQQQQQKPQISPVDMVPQVAIAKTLGGALWKHHKQQQQQQQADQSAAGAAPAAPAAPAGAFMPGSLMDMTTQVNSFSSESLPAELFEPPAGYTQVQWNPQAVEAAAHQ